MARPKAEIKIAPRALSRMRERLDEWRRGNAPRAAFPAKLWTAAGRLAQRHGIYTTARALGVEYNKLKRFSGAAVRIDSAARRRAVEKPVQFIELTGALPVSPSGCRLSLQGPGGQRLQLEMAPSAASEVVLQLCRSGWGAT